MKTLKVSGNLGSRLGILPLLVLTGCGSFFRQPANVEVTRTEVEEIRRENAEMRAMLQDIDTRMEAQEEVLSSINADWNSQLESLSQHLDVLRQLLEDQGIRFENLQRRTTPVQAPVPTAVDTSSEMPGGSLPETSTGLEGGAPTSLNELYDAARRDLLSGKYELAIAGFQDVLKYYPDSDHADNAQYWIGEAHYSLGDMDRAIQELLKVRDLYPEGEKVCAATLKVGYAFLRKEDSATARRYFDTVVRECPDTDEARLAREKLEGMQ